MRFGVGRCGHRTIVRLALVTLIALVLVPAAAAGQYVDRAVTALNSDPVYVDPAANNVSAADADRLRREIRDKGDGPVYIAVLPAAALDEGGGSALGIVEQLHQRLSEAGVYAVVAGNQFRAESTDLGGGKAGKLATKAFDAHHSQGVAPTLLDFVDRVGSERSGTGGGGGGGLGGIGLFPILLIGGVLFFLFRKFKRRRVEADSFREVKETARQDLVELADDVQGLEQKVEGNEPAKRDYLAALDQYSRASSAFDRAANPQQLAPVAEALEEGRYLMASAEARLAGGQPPERRAACFFDPRHGPSVRDVPWSPGGGATREVPACAACALRVEEGQEPDSRHVLVGGQAMPYWAAGPMYGGYFGGFFPGLLLGELMGGFGGFGYGGFGGFGGYGGGWDGGGGSDGGGDFGGGGGDFGGGDFGGGDGGGGDF